MSAAQTGSDVIDVETASPAAIRRFLRPELKQHSVTRRSQDGSELGSVDLDPATFGIVPNKDVLHQVVTAQLAAARAGTQSTKTRAEVRGGGAKPFRQKGTGRARQGSTRSPQWIGGGVALGPKPRSYAQKTPKKMVQLALRSALSDRALGDKVVVIDRWTFEVPRTKDAVAALSALGLKGRILLVLGAEDGYADRSFGNLTDVQTIMSSELNAYDILCNDWVVFTDGTLPGGAAAEAGPKAAPATSKAAPVTATQAASAPETASAPELAPTTEPAPTTESATAPATEAPATEATAAEAPAESDTAAGTAAETAGTPDADTTADAATEAATEGSDS
jgi:large subunit ribosomal protein L4